MLQVSGLRRALGRLSAPSAPHLDIQVGDRFFERGNWESVWIVERIMQPRGVGIPHVVISHQKMRCERRLVAMSLLSDPSRFSPDLRRSEGAAEAELRRRRHDAPRS